ncbi:hypothetical protein H6G76_01600 [Nostoc sp. FACHB-152]|uniref:hypothetical protein n=1 Tax=unclassified Nostoc TaxID=2593658 RepID=UPI0016895D7B|nr:MULTISPECIES: hypothetical protein [unclassified Nostoc]MBD2445866.1 hypothetical protein [Nostoc sp. FACHB-152]MBD2467958.1 hypothetical protein [Nostoc sp. FACHB-145]
MDNFEDFYKNFKQLACGSTTEELSTTQELSATVAVNIQQALLPAIGLSLGLANTQKAEEFSKGVANYATSDEVISSLSEKIGKPRDNETEQEFVERASQTLREILKKKFKI